MKNQKPAKIYRVTACGVCYIATCKNAVLAEQEAREVYGYKTGEFKIK